AAPAVGMALAAIGAGLLASRGLVRAGASLLVAGLMIGASIMVFVEGPYSIRLGLIFVGLAVAGLAFGPVQVLVLGVLTAVAYWALDLAVAFELLGPYPTPDEPRAPAFAVQV